MRLSVPISFGLGIRTIAGALLTAGILHICTAFVLSHTGVSSPYDQLRRGAQINQMRILPVATARQQAVPFQASDMLYAVCPYDVSQGPVVLRAVLPGRGWTLALHSSAGDNFYTMLGQDGRRSDVAVLLVAASERFVPMPRDAGGPQGLLQVPMPTAKGIAVIRAPLAGQAYVNDARTALALASCTPTAP
jgi:uncharacterized membrane protein